MLIQKHIAPFSPLASPAQAKLLLPSAAPPLDPQNESSYQDQLTVPDAIKTRPASIKGSGLLAVGPPNKKKDDTVTIIDNEGALGDAKNIWQEEAEKAMDLWPYLFQRRSPIHGAVYKLAMDIIHAETLTICVKRETDKKWGLRFRTDKTAENQNIQIRCILGSDANSRLLHSVKANLFIYAGIIARYKYNIVDINHPNYESDLKKSVRYKGLYQRISREAKSFERDTDPRLDKIKKSLCACDCLPDMMLTSLLKGGLSQTEIDILNDFVKQTRVRITLGHVEADHHSQKVSIEVFTGKTRRYSIKVPTNYFNNMPTKDLYHIIARGILYSRFFYREGYHVFTFDISRKNLRSAIPALAAQTNPEDISLSPGFCEQTTGWDQRWLNSSLRVMALLKILARTGIPDLPVRQAKIFSKQTSKRLQLLGCIHDLRLYSDTILKPGDFKLLLMHSVLNSNNRYPNQRLVVRLPFKDYQRTDIKSLMAAIIYAPKEPILRNLSRPLGLINVAHTAWLFLNHEERALAELLSSYHQYLTQRGQNRPAGIELFTEKEKTTAVNFEKALESVWKQSASESFELERESFRNWLNSIRAVFIKNIGPETVDEAAQLTAVNLSDTLIIIQKGHAPAVIQYKHLLIASYLAGTAPVTVYLSDTSIRDISHGLLSMTRDILKRLEGKKDENIFGVQANRQWREETDNEKRGAYLRAVRGIVANRQHLSDDMFPLPADDRPTLKRKLGRFSLKYHPDKNPMNPERGLIFRDTWPYWRTMLEMAPDPPAEQKEKNQVLKGQLPRIFKELNRKILSGILHYRDIAELITRAAKRDHKDPDSVMIQITKQDGEFYELLKLSIGAQSAYTLSAVLAMSDKLSGPINTALCIKLFSFQKKIKVKDANQ